MDMGKDHPAIDRDLLLAQRGWVSSVAHSLVRDPGGAEDVVQETMLAALTSPPRDASDARRLRAWLARVAFNLAHLLSRRNMQRRAREERAARTEEQRPTADTVVRESGLQTVVDAVMKLDSPYRNVVILRYFEGLSTADIAVRTGTSDNAVRKRLWRARSKLRSLLDAEHDGDRMAWFNALGPLLSLEVPKAQRWWWFSPQAAWAKAAVLALLAGLGAVCWLEVTSMGDSSLASVPRGLLALETASPTRAWLDDGASGRRVVAAEVGRTALPVEAEPSNESESEPEPPAPPGREVPEAHQPSPLMVRGEVLDLYGRPLAHLKVTPEGDRDQVLAMTRADGSFELAWSGGRGHLVAHAQGFAPLRKGAVDPDEPWREQRLIAAPCEALTGWVTDPHGSGLEAWIEVRYGDGLYSNLDVALDASRPLGSKASTLVDGSFTLGEVVRGPDTYVRASSPGYHPQEVKLSEGRTALAFVLEQDARVRQVLAGVVFSEFNEPLRGADVRLGELTTSTDDRGRFRFEFDALSRGVRLVASKDGFQPTVLDELGDYVGPEEGEHVPALSVRLAPWSGALSGTLTDANGDPLEGWVVAALDSERLRDEADGRGGWSSPFGANDGAPWPENPGDLTGPDGSFTVPVDQNSDYVVVAHDPESLQSVISEPVSGAVDGGMRLEVTRDGTLPTVRGRVLGPAGEPLAYSQVVLGLEFSGVGAAGRRTRTDEQGFFFLQDVPRENVGWRVEHPDAAGQVLDVGSETDPVLVVGRRSYLRLGSGFEGIDSFAVLDESGKVLSLYGPSEEGGTSGSLRGGGSAVYRVSAQARTLLTYSGGEPVGTRPIQLVPGVNSLAP